MGPEREVANAADGRERVRKPATTMKRDFMERRASTVSRNVAPYTHLAEMIGRSGAVTYIGNWDLFGNLGPLTRRMPDASRLLYSSISIRS